MIKDLLCKVEPNVVLLQETEKEKWDRNREWVELPSYGASSRIVIIWDCRIFSCSEVLTIMIIF